MTWSVAVIMRAIRGQLSNCARRSLAARKRRLRQECEFYRSYNAYCRASGLVPFWGDDWKAYRYDRDS
jgi:hypothetical protein